MWCKSCQQDVPAQSAGDKQSLCCPRCGGALHIETTPLARAAAPTSENEPPVYDSWELDEELLHIGRVLQADELKNEQAAAAYQREAARFDLPHVAPTAWHLPEVQTTSKSKSNDKASRGDFAGICTWLSLSMGTAGFVCGGILLGWSLAAGRQELWTIGLPVALVGQVALLIGLVLQLERLWRDNRTAVAKLENVDEQLHELKTTTTLLGSAHGPSSNAFYAHYTGGAGPQLLLTDLKGQLDLLAMKIAHDEQ